MISNVTGHEVLKGLWDIVSWLRFSCVDWLGRQFLCAGNCTAAPRVPNKRFGAVSRNYFRLVLCWSGSFFVLSFILLSVLLVFSSRHGSQKRCVQVICYNFVSRWWNNKKINTPKDIDSTRHVTSPVCSNNCNICAMFPSEQNVHSEYSQTTPLTTFIMANSCFCIVAESMDEIIALTRTALSELAIWPNMS